jgi:glycerol-3-phosphate dehydrogenase subunit B
MSAKAYQDAVCDLLIIGTGLTGMAAALFAAHCRIDAVQTGVSSQIGFSSGLLDLLGVHPLADGKVLLDPWQGIEQLRKDEPDHPYARLSMADIREAMQLVLAFLAENGYPYTTDPGKNVFMLTPAGTLKPTYAVPHTMAYGPTALGKKEPCLLLDFNRLRGFSARQIALSLADRWPALRPLSIEFPEKIHGELYTERMARSLDTAENREKLIEVIRPHLEDARAVGLPAVLGIYRTVQAMSEMQQGLGVPVFEIPTMLPAITGLRLQEVFEKKLPLLGVRSLSQQRVLGVRRQFDGCWELQVGPDRTALRQVTARCVLLCSGRFFGRGLHAERRGIRETIFDLPVTQPADRASWHNKELLHRPGHAINRAGVSVDDLFRPVDSRGRMLYPNLFAAGSILAHQDWMRQKCGSGLAITTAYGAVQACKLYLDPLSARKRHHS